MSLFLLTLCPVDGPISSGLGWLAEMTCSMFIKFCAVVALTPIFLIPGVVIAVLGGWCGQIYMRAQLSVKREMSNARSPVLGHFGAAVAGLSKCNISEASYYLTCWIKLPSVLMPPRPHSSTSLWTVSTSIHELPELFTT
jgi:hypothetical protein